MFGSCRILYQSRASEVSIAEAAVGGAGLAAGGRAGPQTPRKATTFESQWLTLMVVAYTSYRPQGDIGNYLAKLLRIMG